MRLSNTNILVQKTSGSSGQRQWQRLFSAVLAGVSLSSPAAVFAREPPAATSTTDTMIQKLGQGTPSTVVKKIVELNAQKRLPEINAQLKRVAACTGSLELLSNEDIAHAFVQNPKRVTDALERMLRYVRVYKDDRDQKTVDMTIAVLHDNEVGKLFAKHPHSFTSIALSARNYAWMAFETLSDANLGALFDAHPREFTAIARGARTDAYSDFELLKGERLLRMFKTSPQTYVGIYRYDDDKRRVILSGIQSGTATLAQTIVSSISEHDSVAVELGRTIDDLKSEAEGRTRLGELQAEEVIGLLCSNPELFSNTTNKLLFERLRIIMNGSASPIQVQKQFGISDAQMRTMVFRALNHGRLADLVSPENRESDTRILSDLVLGNQFTKTGIHSDLFDEKYFYILANGVEYAAVSLIDLQDRITARKELLQAKVKTSDEEKVLAALDYVLGVITKDGQWSQTTSFDPNYYRGADKKLTVIQVFDRRDTSGFHWNYTVARSKQRYGQPKSENGAVVFENKTSRMVLFMGRTAEDNAKFTRDWIAKHDKGVVTFRGDSIHLTENMPDNIFGNRVGKYVFMIGSCGSAASAPGYVHANPATELKTISYTSTGRGVVTNVILSALLDQKNPIGFGELIQIRSAQIIAADGEPNLIRVWTRGEGLLTYVSQRTKTTVL